MLTRQTHQKNVIYVIIGISKTFFWKYKPYLYNVCHDVMQKATNFNDVATVPVKGSGYRIHFWYMRKNYAINIKNNSNLEKSRLL